MLLRSGERRREGGKERGGEKEGRREEGQERGGEGEVEVKRASKRNLREKKNLSQQDSRGTEGGRWRRSLEKHL